MKHVCLLLLAGYMLNTGLHAQSGANEKQDEPQTEIKKKAKTKEERLQFLLNVALVYYTEKKFEDAADTFERLLAIDPKYFDARHFISVVYINTKEYDKAEAQLKSLVKDYPKNALVKNSLAWLYATAKDVRIRDGRKAVKLAQEAMVLDPEDYHIWNTLAEAYYVIGKYEKAHRAIVHMAYLAERYGTDITKESIQKYNNQIQKYKRALNAKNVIKEE